MRREHAIKLRQMIEKASVSLPDEDALEAVELFELWQIDTAYTVDERIRYSDKLYRCVQAHTSQSNWTPDATPNLWTEVALPGEIPVWKRPTGVQDAYDKGDKVWYPDKNGRIYESIYDGKNSWSPNEYPQGWTKLS